MKRIRQSPQGQIIDPYGLISDNSKSTDSDCGKSVTDLRLRGGLNALEWRERYLKRKPALKGGIREEIEPASEIHLEKQSSIRSQKDKDARRHSTVRQNRVINRVFTQKMTM